MPPPPQTAPLSGSVPIFTFAGIRVYVHWSWLVVAWLVLQFRTNAYDLWIWNVAEYLALFGIVLLHEFGHALACRQVGGEADQIILWPLGGIAFVNPPPRPGPVLWSIAAGPLVNLVLAPITVAAYLVAHTNGLKEASPDADHFLLAVAVMNIGLFLFNMLPIYPLDGGQIAQALLWFVVGRATSLLVVSVLGLVATAGVIVAVLFSEHWDWWLVVIAVFVAIRCVAGFRQARLLARLETAPRHRNAECPSCGAHPLRGPYWACAECHARFDTFQHQGQCPACDMRIGVTSCPECGKAHPIWAWYDAEAAPPSESDER